MKEFFTKDLHSKAKKLPLYLPDNTKSEHYLMVLGFDSKESRAAYAEAERMGFQSINDGNDADVEYLKLYHVQSFIESWSFPDECTLDNKIKFLQEAPYIADAIKAYASSHENFTKKRKR